MTSKQVYTKRNIIAVAALLVVSVAIAFFTSPTFAHAWSQATTQQPEVYTSLAYVDTGHLPQYSRSGLQQHIAFTLSNHENTTMTYHYVTLLSTDTAAQALSQGDITLANNQSASRTILYTMPKPNMTAHIIVQLLGRSEYVTFETKS